MKQGRVGNPKVGHGNPLHRKEYFVMRTENRGSENRRKVDRAAKVLCPHLKIIL